MAAESDGHVKSTYPRHGVQNGVPVGHDIKKSRVATVKISRLKAREAMGDMARHLNRLVIAHAVIVLIGINPVVDFNGIK